MRKKTGNYTTKKVFENKTMYHVNTFQLYKSQKIY